MVEQVVDEIVKIKDVVIVKEKVRVVRSQDQLDRIQATLTGTAMFMFGNMCGICKCEDLH